jgi:hypothetical protein
MPQIKKVKRDAMTDLGDEWDILTEAEVQQSGILVEADEIIVVAKAPPTPGNGGQGNEEVRTLQGRLHSVNQEAATRRIALREAQQQLDQIRQENEGLKKKDAERALAEAKDNAKSLFVEYTKEKKLEFVSAEAGDDVREAAFAQVDWTKPITKEAIGTLVDGVVDKKKYVLKTVTLPPTDGGRTSAGTEGVVMDDDLLEQVAREYNIPYKKE